MIKDQLTHEMIESVRDDIRDFEIALEQSERDIENSQKWIDKLKVNIKERKETLAGLLGEDTCGHDDNL